MVDPAFLSFSQTAQPILSRQHEIQQDQVNRLAHGHFQAGLAVPGRAHDIAVLAQAGREEW